MTKISTISSRIREALTTREMTQGKLAVELGVTDSIVSQWLADKKEPGRELVVKAAGVLGVDPAWLAFGTGKPPLVDLDKQRKAYKKDTAWVFRKTPEDGGRDFGNANLWAIPWDIETLVKEALQNSIDAAVDSKAGVEVCFHLIKLTGSALDEFLDAMKWNNLSNNNSLLEHIEMSSANKQKLGGILRDGLEHIKDRKELILLRIDDYETKGLTGNEEGEGNFPALCRNNLDSNKSSEVAGGAYGLGKAVFWRASQFATVFFCSNLESPLVDENGNVLQDIRIIGKADLAYHELTDQKYAGPGWFGSSTNVKDGRPSKALSVWGNQALANDLYLDRGSAPGTSILVVGFQDISSDSERSLEDTAAEFERAVSKNFWPALFSKGLTAKIIVSEGHTQKSSIVVDPKRYHPFFVDAVSKYAKNEIVEKLEKDGDVAAKQIAIKIPKRLRDPKHDSLIDECLLIIRRSSDNDQTDQVNQVAFYRGQEMVIMYQNLKNLVSGGAPFHAVVLCGAASGSGETDIQAEQFFRTAEPPAHDRWMLTPELKVTYAQGSRTNLEGFFRAVRDQIRELIRPTYENLDDGPRALKELLRIQKTDDGPVPMGNAPKLIIDQRKSHVLENGSWEVHVRVKLPDDRTWRIVPVLQFAAESGSSTRVSWNLIRMSGCEIEGDSAVSIPNSREMYFVGTSDPTSHPIPAEDSAVSVVLQHLQTGAR